VARVCEWPHFSRSCTDRFGDDITLALLCGRRRVEDQATSNPYEWALVPGAWNFVESGRLFATVRYGAYILGNAKQDSQRCRSLERCGEGAQSLSSSSL
jgi:hypothetical protein